MPKIQYDINGSPIYNKEDWPSYDEFQKAALGDLKRSSSKLQTVQQGPQPHQQGAFYNNVGRYVPVALPTLGGVAGEVAEPAGGGIIGAGLGSAGAEALKRAYPNLFGEPSSGLGTAANIATDMALQGVVPAVARGVLGGGISDVLDSLKSGYGITGKLASAAKSALSSGSKNLSTGKEAIVDLLRAIGAGSTIEPSK